MECTGNAMEMEYGNGIWNMEMEWKGMVMEE
jgi:hypothetical protein